MLFPLKGPISLWSFQLATFNLRVGQCFKSTFPSRTFSAICAPLAHPSQLPKEWPTLSTGLESQLFQVRIRHTKLEKDRLMTFIYYLHNIECTQAQTIPDRAPHLDFSVDDGEKSCHYASHSATATEWPLLHLRLQWHLRFRLFQTRKCDDSPVETIGISSQKRAQAEPVSLSWRSLLRHIGHGLGRRQEEAQHGCEEDHTGAGESKEQVEDVPGQAGNAKGTKSLLGEETVNQSAHILIASGCCQHTLGQSKCQSNSQAKGKWHHGRRRLHAGFHLFNWCCHGCANLVTWSLTLSEGGWDKALNGWQSKDHQAASNHLGGKSHLASSADKGQLEHGHCLTGFKVRWQFIYNYNYIYKYKYIYIYINMNVKTSNRFSNFPPKCNLVMCAHQSLSANAGFWKKQKISKVDTLVIAPHTLLIFFRWLSETAWQIHRKE